MINEIWLVETSNNDYEAFKELEDAKNHAKGLLVSWGYDPEDDQYNVFKELDATYNDKRYAGFYVDDLIWCYQINYHS